MKNNTSNNFFPLDNNPNVAARRTMKIPPNCIERTAVRLNDIPNLIDKGIAIISIKRTPESICENSSLVIGLYDENAK